MKHSYLTPWYLLIAKITKLLLMNKLRQANLCILDKNLALTEKLLQKISIIVLVYHSVRTAQVRLLNSFMTETVIM